MGYYWNGNQMVKMPDQEQLRLSDFYYLEDLKSGNYVRNYKKNHRY